MVQTLSLQEGVIYGPVNSRRLGRSLGINLMPAGHKVCSFDCVYCHYGRTDLKTVEPEAGLFLLPQKVLEEVERALHEYQALDYLTFSGNGEPTLYPYFGEVAREVRRLRDYIWPELGLAILSNSSTAWNPSVREALEEIDMAIMKLDAGDEESFARLNRPAAKVNLEEVIAGLAEMPKVVIQSVIIDGSPQNFCGEPQRAWLLALAKIRPEAVQIYSTDRPVAEPGVKRVPKETLIKLASRAEEEIGILVRVY